MTLTQRFSTLLLACSLGTPVLAGADPDAHRKPAKGHLLFTGEGMQVGQTYEGFMISFPGNETVYLSPSRYRVSYAPDALACRNAASFPVEAAKNGHWWTVSFEVLAIKETAIEDPPSSGKWVWQQSFDCLYKDLKEAK